MPCNLEKVLGMDIKKIIFALSCSATYLFAANSINIQGTVLSAKDNTPIEGASVTLLQNNISDITGSDGTFLLQKLEESSANESSSNAGESNTGVTTDESNAGAVTNNSNSNDVTNSDTNSNSNTSANSNVGPNANASNAAASASNAASITDTIVNVQPGTQGIRTSLNRHNYNINFSNQRFFSVNGRQTTRGHFTRNTSIYYSRSRNNPAYAMRSLRKEAESTGFSDTLLVEADGHISKKIALTSSTETVKVTLDTIPVAAIVKQGAGSSSQQVSQNSAIADFSFKIENADSATVKGCPKGVETKFEKGTLYFSGKVTDAVGTYEYTVTTVGGYNTATRSGKFTVVEAEASSTTTAPAKLVADGYASLNGGTTGGEGGDTVVVSTYAAFKAAIQTDKPKVVVVKGTIKTTDGDGYGLAIYSNTTIMGADSSATIYGGLVVNGKKNVIIYNINIHGTYPNPGPSDGIAVSHGATNVWIHHVNIWDAEDGNLDITTQASYVTVSYVHFWYTDPNHPHRLNALIGSGASNHPEDFNKLKVTYHHCWFGTLVNERMPRVMYGNAHIYNNYYTASDNLYCVGVGSYGSALIENNYFTKVNNPVIFMYNVYAYINTKNNVYDNVKTSSNSSTTPVEASNGGKIYGERYITTDPYTLKEDPAKLDKVPYEYSMDKAADVPNIVKKQAGPHNY